MYELLRSLLPCLPQAYLPTDPEGHVPPSALSAPPAASAQQPGGRTGKAAAAEEVDWDWDDDAAAGGEPQGDKASPKRERGGAEPAGRASSRSLSSNGGALGKGRKAEDAPPPAAAPASYEPEVVEVVGVSTRGAPASQPASSTGTPRTAPRAEVDLFSDMVPEYKPPKKLVVETQAAAPVQAAPAAAPAGSTQRLGLTADSDEEDVGGWDDVQDDDFRVQEKQEALAEVKDKKKKPKATKATENEFDDF